MNDDFGQAHSIVYGYFGPTSIHQELHANALQRYSHAALRDGLDNPTIRDLASLASWGKHMSNAERDLHTMIPSLFGSEFPTYPIEIEVYDPDKAMVKPMVIPILLASDA